MADMISRAAAIDAIISETIYPDRETIDKVCGASPSEDNGWVGGIRDAINAVEEVNAVDAVPVVRCRDCKHCNTGFRDHFGMCMCDGEFVGPTDYCSCGERRDA